jgi:NADH-quinone oxidoreductase subunit N
MTVSMLVPLLPLILPSGAAFLAMLLIAVRRSHAATALIAALGLAAGLGALPWSSQAQPRQITSLLLFDGYALLFIGMIFAASLVVVALSYGYFQRRDGQAEELYVLLLLAAIGAGTLAASTHFASFFLGLEVLSVSLYALLAYQRSDARGLEAGIKYLVLAASSAAFLLFGFALIYAESGTMDLRALARTLAAAGGQSFWILAGLALSMVGVGFKLAVVPFHLWTADVYEGSPAPVTAFLATASKGAMFAVLLRFFMPVEAPSFRLLLVVIAIASMLTGNLLALRQKNLKRILAYSSISHFGYLLVAFLAGGRDAVAAIAFYLVAYFVTILGAFAVISEHSQGRKEADALADYQGLTWSRPWLASVLAVSLLSLAGIPLTAGFVGKFYVMQAGVRADLWLALMVLVVGSAIGLYYYLGVVVVLFQAKRVDASSESRLSVTGSVVGAMLVALLWLGIFPGQLLALIHRMLAVG